MLKSILFFVALLVLTSCANNRKNSATKLQPDNDFMYQYSIIDALLAGAFDGDMTIGELKKKGDFGIGTFNRADGELLMNEGVLYRTRYDGSTQVVPDTDSTSAAFIKFFKSDTSWVMEESQFNYATVQKKLVEWMNPNSMYAIRISGHFATMNTRAEYPAEKPYPTLSEHLKTKQTLFNLSSTNGVCVGFWLPVYLARTNVPGFHFHYMADDKKSGGHIFDFTSKKIKIEVDEIKGFSIEANTNPDFKTVNLQADRSVELKNIE
jgi:acetolactate decarboxylase